MDCGRLILFTLFPITRGLTFSTLHVNVGMNNAVENGALVQGLHSRFPLLPCLKLKEIKFNKVQANNELSEEK